MRGGRWMASRRSAVSMVEAVVVVAVLALIVIATAGLARSGHRHSSSLDFWAGAHQTAQVLEARVRADFESFVPGTSPSGRLCAGTRPEVTFDVVSAQVRPDGLPLDSDGGLLTETVTYRFDSTTRQVTRNGKPVLCGSFEQVGFTWLPEPDGGRARACEGTLAVDVQIVPPGSSGRVRDDTPVSRFRFLIRPPQAMGGPLTALWASDR